MILQSLILTVFLATFATRAAVLGKKIEFVVACSCFTFVAVGKI